MVPQGALRRSDGSCRLQQPASVWNPLTPPLWIVHNSSILKYFNPAMHLLVLQTLLHSEIAVYLWQLAWEYQQSSVVFSVEFSVGCPVRTLRVWLDQHADVPPHRRNLVFILYCTRYPLNLHCNLNARTEPARIAEHYDIKCRIW